MSHTVRSLAMASTLLFLTGCSAQSLLDTPPPPQIYLLRPKLGTVRAPQVSWSLAVGQPSAPMSLQTTRIAIQRSVDTLDFYANAAWQDRTPALLERLIVEGFQDSGKIAAVAGEGDGVHADYLLQTDIRRFEADYHSPKGAPEIVVELTARLIRLSDRKVVATTVIRKTRMASSNSVPAAVKAFDGAMRQTVEQLVGWTLKTPGA